MSHLTIKTNNAFLFTTYMNTLNNQTVRSFDLLFSSSSFFESNSVSPVYSCVDLSYDSNVSGVIIPVSITGVPSNIETITTVQEERNIILPPDHIDRIVCEVENQLISPVCMKKGMKLATVRCNTDILVKVEKLQ